MGQSTHRLLEHREVLSRNVLGGTLAGKVAHRGIPGVRVAQGNHTFSLPDRAVRTAATQDLTVLHFLMHCRAQFENKIRLGGAAYRRNTRLDPALGGTWRTLYEKDRAGTLEAFLDGIEFDAERLARGVGAGELVHDARLAEYLRSMPAPAARRLAAAAGGDRARNPGRR